MYESITSGAVSGILSGLVTASVLALVALVGYRLRVISKYRLCLEHRPLFEDPNIKLGVLHAQNNNKQIVNRVYRPRQNKAGCWTVRVSFPRHIGFQYKWFIDYTKPWSGPELKRELEKACFTHVSEGKGEASRVWFVLRDKPQADDGAGHSNNCFYPE